MFKISRFCRSGKPHLTLNLHVCSYDSKRHKPQSKEKAERAKLLYKIKKEQKGALREIRKDRSFLGRIKINQRIQRLYKIASLTFFVFINTYFITVIWNVSRKLNKYLQRLQCNKAN